MNVPEEQAATFMHTFKARYKGISKFIEKTITFCRREGYVSTIMRRKRLLPNIRSTSTRLRNHAERQAINTTVQGSAADLVKIAMINIHNRINKMYLGDNQLHGNSMHHCLSSTANFQWKPKLVLQLHDELLFEVKQKDLDSLASIVKQEMESALKLRVKLNVKVKAGRCWGELTHYTCSS